MTLAPSTFTKLKDIPALTGLVILVGPPGSGKSTFAKRLVRQQGLGSGSYISNDKIAKELFGVAINRDNKDGDIFAEQDRQIAAGNRSVF